jgi:hypothetical protein
LQNGRSNQSSQASTDYKACLVLATCSFLINVHGSYLLVLIAKPDTPHAKASQLKKPFPLLAR